MSEPPWHIRPELALIVAALADDDPLRRSVLSHVAGCERCRALLAEAEATLALLDACAQEPPPLDPCLKQRILASVARAPQRRRGIGWEQLALACAGTSSAWLGWLDGHARTGLYPAHGPLCLLWELLGVSLALTVGAWSKRRVAVRTPARLALVATTGALLGQLWLRYRCPTHDATWHVLVFHVSGVALIALAGLAVDAR